VALHPVIGPLLLFALLFVMFQAVFAWSAVRRCELDRAGSALEDIATGNTQPGLCCAPSSSMASLPASAAVVVFLPQIVILFFFILALEDSGYMPRGAFLMDRLMARCRPLGPLLHPAAVELRLRRARHHGDPHDLRSEGPPDHHPDCTTDDLLGAAAGLCSDHRRLHPAQSVRPGINLQGLVLFALYVAGIVGAMLAALVLRRTVTKGTASGFLMECPNISWPSLPTSLLGLWQRAVIFLRRAGTIIFTSTIILWVLLSFPQAAEGLHQVDSSIATASGPIASGLRGHRADRLQPRHRLALIPAMAAREVAVSALATTYASTRATTRGAWSSRWATAQGRWSLPTALAFLAWFVFAPQCISTIAVTRRETNGWKWPASWSAIFLRSPISRRASPTGRRWRRGYKPVRARNCDAAISRDGSLPHPTSRQGMLLGGWVGEWAGERLGIQ
jgi:ferrous iron transport protein B